MHETGQISSSPVPGMPGTQSGPPIDKSQAIYEYIAFQVNREDGLINYRLTWTLQLNGFLFAAIALIAEPGKVDPAIRQLLMQVLPITGLATSIAGLTGIIAANMAIRDLTKLWTERSDCGYPRPFGHPIPFLLGLLPSVLLPAFLVFVWLYTFVRL